MSANGLEVFDKTIQTTHIWLNEITEVIGPDRQLAWKVLSTVLHKLRDRLPVDVAARGELADIAAALVARRS